MEENQPDDVGGRSMGEFRIATAPIRDVEFRDATGTPDGSWTISGYAAVFDQETTLMDGNFAVVKESIAPGAFTRVLGEQPLVHLNFGHDMNRVVASTKVGADQIGGLRLAEDARGLYYMARVDKNDPDAQALAVKMQRGVVDQASFAFTIAREESTTTDLEDGRMQAAYRILEVKQLFDVCCAAQGAYPQTSSMLRSLAAQHTGQPAFGTFVAGAAPISVEMTGRETISTPVGGQDEARMARARARARARAADHHLKGLK